MTKQRLVTILFTITAILTACASPSPDKKPSQEVKDKPPIDMTLSFQAKVGDKDFACGQKYQGLGTDQATLTPVDFRMYITEVRLLRSSDGKEVPFVLSTDNLHQSKGVALLDFEDGSGACSNGNQETYRVLKGKAPKDTYRGIRFRVSVPLALNHQDLTALPSPLNDTTLSWTWNYGRIFLSAMGSNDTGIHLVHLGSTGCTGDATLGDSVSCTKPNRPEYTLPDFDPSKDTILADWGALFAQTTLNTGVKGCRKFKGNNFCGCHSRGPDEVCSPPFQQLGLTWKTGKMTPDTQKLFRLAPR